MFLIRVVFLLCAPWFGHLQGASPLILQVERPQGSFFLQHVLQAEEVAEDQWQQRPIGVVGLKWRIPLLNPDFQFRGHLQAAKQPQTTIVEQLDSVVELNYLVFKTQERRLEFFANGVYPVDSTPSYGFLGLKMPVHIQTSTPYGRWWASSRVNAYGLFISRALEDGESFEMTSVPDNERFIFDVSPMASNTPAGFASYGLELAWSPDFMKSVALHQYAQIWRGWLPTKERSGTAQYQNIAKSLCGSKIVWNIHEELAVETEALAFWDGFYAAKGARNVPQYETRMSLVTRFL